MGKLRKWRIKLKIFSPIPSYQFTKMIRKETRYRFGIYFWCINKFLVNIYLNFKDIYKLKIFNKISQYNKWKNLLNLAYNLKFKIIEKKPLSLSKYLKNKYNNFILIEMLCYVKNLNFKKTYYQFNSLFNIKNIYELICWVNFVKIDSLYLINNNNNYKKLLLLQLLNNWQNNNNINFFLNKNYLNENNIIILFSFIYKIIIYYNSIIN